ncbi:sulfate transporter-like [Corticium candelabrum]|uniref:sulfate transporter-like n=1 Tax=Corticium candelabrum TaxID=121492 RepID=UPI002E258894|nr:sulfate transporter-like [Corticium candelabrum]
MANKRNNDTEETRRLFSGDSSSSYSVEEEEEEEGPEEEANLPENRIVNEFALLSCECVAQAPLNDRDLPRVQPPGLENLQFVDSSGRSILKRIRCSRAVCSFTALFAFIKGIFPIVYWLPRYQIRSNAILDLAAGLTLGVMLIPQGMAYAFLADIPPVYGLYTCLFPSIVYLLMGTSRQMSVGAFSLVSILTSQAIRDYTATLGKVHQINGTSGMNATEKGSGDVILYATTLSFLVGILQIVMAVCRLGFLASYLSDALISGFTTGAAIQIVTSQVSSVFGFNSDMMPSGIFKVPKIWIYLFEHFTDINVACFIIALASGIVLISCKVLSLQLQLKFPVPGELLVVAFGTALSWAFDFKNQFNVPVLNDIPSGLPTPKVPPLSATLVKNFAESTFVISLISYAVSVSIALTFANKFSYSVRPNQELLALGVVNFVSSFFSCFPSSGSLSRSSVVANTKGKTLLSTFIGSLVVLVVVVALAQLFKTLPKAVLGAIIVIALKGLFTQFADVKRLWKVKKADCFVWFSTFLGVVILNITYGLLVGLGATIIVMFFTMSMPVCEILERVDVSQGVTYIPVRRNKQYISSERFDVELSTSAASVDMSLIKVFRIHGPLVYFNHSYIFSKLSELVCPPSSSESSEVEVMITKDVLVKGIILEASTLTSVDSAGVAALVTTILAYEKCGVFFVLANCNASVKNVLLRSGFQAKFGHKHLLFKTTNDAVRYIGNTENYVLTSDGDRNRVLDSMTRISGRRNRSIARSRGRMDEMNSMVSDSASDQ